MGKFIFLLLGIAAFISLVVIYFQLLTSIVMLVPFFTDWIPLDMFIIYVALLGILSGVFITLAIKGFMSGGTMTDEFDL